MICNYEVFVTAVKDVVNCLYPCHFYFGKISRYSKQGTTFSLRLTPSEMKTWKSYQYQAEYN